MRRLPNSASTAPPNQIYTGDIEQFYPNTPHILVVEAFAFYHPKLKGERHILKRLLDYNYATDGKDIYYLGTTGIPMGLPLAPELARMCTAYLLRDYQPPPNECLTVYFDDVASTYPIDNLPLGPYNLKPTQPNTTQDCIYDPTTRKFLPIQQQYRQPVLLHPLSYHPSKNMAKNTYLSSAARASKTATDPSDCLEYLLLKYLPALVRNGHNTIETIQKLTTAAYFPALSPKQEWEFKPIIRYTWSDTRPNKKQLQPLEMKDYHLIPTLPLAPLKALLSYQPPKTTYKHEWQKCSNIDCIMCNNYDLYTTSTLAVPVTTVTTTAVLYTSSTTQEPTTQNTSTSTQH